MKLYKNDLVVGSKKKMLITINQHENNVEKVQNEIGNFHWIHAIDKSGSMYASIAELIEDLIASLSFVGENDIVTVLEFDSEGSTKIIVQGAKNTPQLKDLLRQHKHAGGFTCFREPLAVVKDIIQTCKTLAQNCVVNLFTDGMPCCSLSDVEEFKRAISNAESFSKDVIALNTVGYGNFYSQEFLKNLAGTSQYGRFTHASNIREYSKIFDINRQIVNENVMESIEIKTTMESPIVYLNRKMTKIHYNHMQFNQLDKNKNQFFILADTSDDFSFVLNDEKICVDEISEEANEQTLVNFLYAYAYNLYSEDRRDEALNIIVKNLHNGYLADRQLNAWTADEVSVYMAALMDRVLNPFSRKLDTVCKSNYLPAKNAFCFMDLMDLFINDDAKFLPYHSAGETYERIGKSTNYTEYAFVASDKEKVSGSFKNLVFNKSRCNIGIKFAIDGYVELDKKDQTKTMKRLTCCDFRTHNIILDGFQNMKTLVVKMSSKLANSLVGKVNIECISKKECIYKVDITSIPVMNRGMVDKINANYVANLIDQSILLEINHKMIGHFLEKLGSSKAIQHEHYDPTESALLESYGIDKTGTYRGLGRSTSKNADCDFYMGKNIEFSIKGSKKIPSVNEFLKSTSKNPIIATMRKQYDSYSKLDIQQLRDALEYNTGILNTVNMELAIIKMASILTGKWIEGFKKNDKNEFVFERDNVVYLMDISEEKHYY